MSGKENWRAHARWWARTIFQLTELNIKANPSCFQCAHARARAQMQMWGMTLIKLVSMLKISILLIPDILWNGFFSGCFMYRWFHSHDLKSDHMTINILTWMVKVCSTPVAAQRLQIPQKFQVQGKSYPCDRFCICWTLLCNISWIASC